MNKAAVWFTKWCLQINTQNTATVLFNRHKIHPAGILLFAQEISWSPSASYLGVTFDKRLFFYPHINKIVQKANKIKNYLYCVINCHIPIPIKIKQMFLNLYIRPLTTYNSQTWGSLISKKNWAKIETTQNNGFRTITANPRYISDTTLLTTFKSPSIHDFIKNR